MTSKRLPKSVQVGPYCFVVHKCVADDLNAPDDELDTFGQTLIPSLEIFVRTDIAEDMQAEVLLHEVLHAIYYASNLRSRFADEEEDIVSELAIELLDVLRRNPKLTDFLLGKESIE